MAARDPAMAHIPEQTSPVAAALAERILNFVLFITVLTSAIAFIEPSPHDVLMFVLLVACVLARVPFDRKLTPLLLLTGAWLIGGFLSLIQVGDEPKALQYTGTSAYLGIATVMFACLFSDANPVRLSILRRAYILAALMATAAGFIGFFHLLPGSDIFLLNERVSGTFKDPNVYGPFLVFPLVLLMLSLLTRGIKLFQLVVVAALLGGLFLSFSRGAWIHFAVSTAISIAILLAVTPDPRMRTRIVLLSIVAAFAASLLLLALLSISSVHDLFLVRAQVLQPYDVGSGGRFGLQELALGAILAHPNGMGPNEFGIMYGGQQHDVYMQVFLDYGWLGGAAYLTLVLATLAFGLTVMQVRTPWQNYLIAAYGAFVGEVVEGFIIDSDHWRHFFLLLGLIWGLIVATINLRRRRAWEITGQQHATMLAATS